MQRVALIEPAHSHEEVLFPQIELLRRQFEVHVIAPRSLLEVDLLHDTAPLYRAWSLDMPPAHTQLARALDTLRKYGAIREAVKSINPDILIFNSTYSLPEVALIHRWFRDYPKIQIIHNFQRFLRWPARKLYQAFDANLVISEQVHTYVTTHHREFSNLEYFLPIFFGSFSSDAGRTLPEPGDEYPIRLGVFGSMEQSRRNYNGLLQALRNLGHPLGKAGFRVCLAGKTPPELRSRIQKYRLDDIMEYQTDFVPFRAMFNLLRKTDIVLFLIDGDVRYARHYNQYKISGTSTLMKAFRMAGATSTDFNVDDSLRDACFSYPGTDMGSLLRQIADRTITRDDIKRKTGLYDDRPDFLFSTQEARLVSIVKRVASRGAHCGRTKNAGRS
jgi:glycosyltransferase involved in cell wall biosynthesis